MKTVTLYEVTAREVELADSFSASRQPGAAGPRCSMGGGLSLLGVQQMPLGFVVPAGVAGAAAHTFSPPARRAMHRSAGLTRLISHPPTTRRENNPKMTKKPKKYMRPGREMPKIDMAFLLRRCTQAPAEDGGCLIWNRQMKNGPITTIDGQVWKVRHLVWKGAHQRKSKSTHIPMPTVCQDERCVHIDHLTLVKRNHHQVGTKLPLLQRMRIAQTKRANSAKLDEERARDIRASTETLRALAQSNGIALSLVHRIKTGQSWLNYRDPFLQLATCNPTPQNKA